MCDFQQFFDFYMKNTFDKPNAFSKAPNTNSTSPSEDDEKSPEDTIPSQYVIIHKLEPSRLFDY